MEVEVPCLINVLDMKMILQCIQWRARFKESMGKRWIHLADSMVCNYILSKGRTSSLMLQPVVKQINAYLLALNAVQLQAHVDSSENPTAAASRLPETKSGRDELKKRGKALVEELTSGP